jgi:GxxExxY protein
MICDDEITATIIHCVIRVHQVLGPGYSEGVYRRAMVIELRKQKLEIEVEKVVFIYYDNVKIGRHVIDIVVAKKVVLELKAVDALGKAHYAQVRSYLKSTGLKVGLLVNFDTERADYRRITSPPSPTIAPSPKKEELSGDEARIGRRKQR